MNASGHGGELRVGYQQAAQIGEWSLQATPTIPMLRFAVEASIYRIDKFWITQLPMVLDLQFGRFHWRWVNVTPSFDKDHVAVQVFGKPAIVKD